MASYDKLTPDELSNVTTLSPRQCEALQLLKLYEGDFEKVAEEMEITEGAVRSMKSKVFEKADTARSTVKVVRHYDEEWAESADRRDNYTPIAERE